MTIDLIAELAMGTAEIPESEPAEPVVVVIDIEPNLSTDVYDVSLILPSTLPPADVAVTAQTTSDVTLTVTRPDGYAGTPGITVHALCILRNDTLDTGEIDVSALVDTGWTVTVARLRQLGPVTYFYFDLTAGVGIDGIPKSDSVRVLDLSTVPEMQPNAPILGSCFTDSSQPIKVTSAGDLFVEGMSGTTGTWTDGTTFLYGQISWMAG